MTDVTLLEACPAASPTTSASDDHASFRTPHLVPEALAEAFRRLRMRCLQPSSPEIAASFVQEALLAVERSVLPFIDPHYTTPLAIRHAGGADQMVANALLQALAVLIQREADYTAALDSCRPALGLDRSTLASHRRDFERRMGRVDN